MDLHWLTITEAQKGLREKQFSAMELTQACLKRVQDTDERLKNFVLVTEDKALEQAERVDQKIAAGETLGLLEGIPGSLKDLFNTRNIRTTSCSNMLRNFVPPYESTPSRRLEEAGYVLLGKNNMDEFACGFSTERSCFGPSHNPWNVDYVPGGSSGGSASAVSAGQTFFSLGTDTGGSIRQPASLCSCVGLKPSYGRVSRFGVNAMASSWDHIGPFTRTVGDAALVMQVIAGHDPYDSTTAPVEVPNYSLNLGKGLKGLRIGIPEEYFALGVEPEVAELVNAAIKECEKMGAHLKKVHLPMTKYSVAIYYITTPGELSTNLARLDGLRYGHNADPQANDLIGNIKQNRGEGFGDEIKRRIMVGTFVLSAGYADAYYKQAQRARTLVIREFEEVFKEVDVLMGPVSPNAGFKIGEKINDPLAMYLADVLTIPANAAGLPAISVPCGFTSAGLPVGLQIMGPQWSEPLVLQTAAAYEQASEWHTRRPAF